MSGNGIPCGAAAVADAPLTEWAEKRVTSTPASAITILSQLAIRTLEHEASRTTRIVYLECLNVSTGPEFMFHISLDTGSHTTMDHEGIL